MLCHTSDKFITRHLNKILYRMYTVPLPLMVAIPRVGSVMVRWQDHLTTLLNRHLHPPPSTLLSAAAEPRHRDRHLYNFQNNSTLQGNT